MNIKPLTLLGVGTLGIAAGIGMCWVSPGGFRARAYSSPNPVASVDRDPGTPKVLSGLLSASADAFEGGTSPDGKSLLFAAMAHPAASSQEFKEAVGFAISRASAPKTSLQLKCELLQGAAARVIDRIGTAKDPQTLSGLFEMRDKLAELHQDVADDASQALLARIEKMADDPAADLFHNLVRSDEWHDFVVAKRCAAREWEQPEEIAESVAELIKRVASTIPSRKELEGLLPVDDPERLSNEGDGSGVIEAKKAILSKMLRDASGDEIVAIPRVLGDRLLSEHYEDLAAELVAAIRSCEAIQLKAYNLWALNRIHAAETAPGWEGFLAPIETSYLQSVVATLYGDVSRRRLDAESQPVQRAAKVRVMIRQAKGKPTNF